LASLLTWPVLDRDVRVAQHTARAATGFGGHIPALDGIRGLAVLMVLIFHIFQVEPAPQHALLRLGYAGAMLGQTGVDLFFVLSGFLITGILYDAKGSRRYFINFYGRRALRIFPLYYGFSVVMLVLVPRILGFSVTELPWVSLLTFSANFAMAAGSAGGMLGHYWSLAIEEQFYLAWPFLVFALSRVALMRLCLASMIVSAWLRWMFESHGIPVFTLTPCRIDTLLVGAMLALAARSPTGLVEWSRRAGIATIVALAAAVPLYLALRNSGSASLQVIKYPLIAILYGALLTIGVTTSPGSWFGRLLTLGPLSNLGKYSYGIYVYHPPMIHVVGWFVALASARLALPAVHPAASLIVRVALIVGSSYTVAWVSWHVFERPFLSLKRYFEYDAREAEPRALASRSQAGATTARSRSRLGESAPTRAQPIGSEH
jgi:peptidoglycan/LPS O-acetylase OafA/YrhL